MKNKELQIIRNGIGKCIAYLVVAMFLLFMSPIIILVFLIIPLVVIAKWCISNDSLKLEWNKMADEMYSDMPIVKYPKFNVT